MRGDGAHRGEEDLAPGGLVAELLERLAVGRTGIAPSAYGALSGSVSCRFGNSVSPVSGSFRWATCGPARRRPRRCGPAASRRRGRRTAAGASIRPSSSQPATARSSVSFSTANAPPAGSATLADVGLLDQQRGGVAAIRRLKPSGRPSGKSNGSTVTAPHRRRRRERRHAGAQHVHQGSYLVIIGLDVSAWSTMCDGLATPLSSSIRAHRRRTARSLAMVTNCSSLAASRPAVEPRRGAGR